MNPIAAEPLIWDAGLIQRFWDYHARFPETYFTSQFGKGIIRSVRKYLPAQGSILDYACGTGALAGHMLEEGLQVAACDLSADSLAVVRDKFKGNGNFLGALSVAELGASAGRFDAAFLVELAEHADDAALFAIFNAVKQALKPGGVAIITTPNDENLSDSMVFCPCCNKTFHRLQHVRSWSAATLTAMLKAQGMEPIAVFATDFSLATDGLSGKNILRRLARRAMGRKPPHLVSIARKTP